MMQHLNRYIKTVVPRPFQKSTIEVPCKFTKLGHILTVMLMLKYKNYLNYQNLAYNDEYYNFKVL